MNTENTEQINNRHESELAAARGFYVLLLWSFVALGAFIMTLSLLRGHGVEDREDRSTVELILAIMAPSVFHGGLAVVGLHGLIYFGRALSSLDKIGLAGMAGAAVFLGFEVYDTFTSRFGDTLLSIQVLYYSILGILLHISALELKRRRDFQIEHTQDDST